MKRNISDMDSDCDDVFGDDSKGTPTQSNDSCQMLNRKRRRGIIEKRRRDRINYSLTELRRLVPAAFEKQGSAKLEKAEILQMTVDHLKMLHAKGFDALSFDPHKFAMDYHSIGFRECASEVARYLVAIEGMDLQDPLRLRIMSHLQCYSAQRELSLKSSIQTHSWNPSGFSVPTPQYPPGPSSAVVPPQPTEVTPQYSCAEPATTRITQSMDTFNYSRVPSTGNHNTSSTMPPSSGMPLVQHPTTGPPPPSMMSSLTQMQNHQSYLGSHGFAGSSYGSTGHFNQHPGSSGRPYRPWGAELAY